MPKRRVLPKPKLNIREQLKLKKILDISNLKYNEMEASILTDERIKDSGDEIQF